MTTSLKNRLPRAIRASLFTLALGLPMVVAADQSWYSSDHSAQRFSQGRGPSTLIDKVRRATERYLDINVALNELPEHWVRGTPCVSGPNAGAMGVHFIKPSRVRDGMLKAEEPEALIYEPLPNGAYRLVGVEFIVVQSDWEQVNPGAGPPALEGHLTNLVTDPNRYGLPAFYELHVWAWEQNPNGTFADWNTQVSCNKQAGD